jgi:hypothetical protein
MTAQWQSFASDSGTVGGDPTVTKPTGTVDGNLLIAYTIATAGNTITAPAGGATWNLHAVSLGVNARLWWKIASGEPANYTFVNSGAGNSQVVVVRVTNFNAANPIDVASGFSGTGTLVIPSVTPTGPDRLLLQLVAKNSNTTFTGPGTATERWDALAGGFGSAGGDEVVGAAATGTRTWTPSSANVTPGVGFMVAINPAIQNVAVTGFDITVQFGTPTIVQDQAVTPAGFDVAVQFGTPTLVQEQVVSPAGFDLDVEYGTPAIKQTVAPAGFDIDVEFGVPTLVQEQVVAPDGFDLTVQFGVPTLLQELIVAPTGFDIDVEFGTPTLSQKVAPTGFDLTVEFGTPSLAFKQVVAVTGFDMDVQFGTPTVSVQPIVTGTVFNHETGVHVGAGVVVKLFDDSDVLVDTTTTDAAGVFSFARPFGDTGLYWTLATYDVLGVQYHGVSDRGCPAV